MRHSHNLPLPRFPEYTPVLYKVTLPESTSSLKNIPPFSTTICDAPKAYLTLPESTPPSQNIYPLTIDMRPSQNLPIIPEYTPFSITMCDPPRIYPLLPEEDTPPFFTTICDTPIFHLSLPEYTPFI